MFQSPATGYQPGRPRAGHRLPADPAFGHGVRPAPQRARASMLSGPEGTDLCVCGAYG